MLRVGAIFSVGLLLAASGLVFAVIVEPGTVWADDRKGQFTLGPTASPTPTATQSPTATPSPKATAQPAKRSPTASPTSQKATPAAASATATSTPTGTPTTTSAEGATPATSGEWQPAREQTDVPSGDTASDAVVIEPTPTPTPRPTRAVRLGRSPTGLSLHVLQYLPLILGAAEQVGVDPAVLAALMETEGSGEDAVSHAGALGVMQLMPDKLLETDDPFDPGTNILRAAQLVRRLMAAWNGDLAAVAGAYFGAVDREGRITDDSDGFATGLEYVGTFAEAYERWAVALDQPVRPVAIRPVVRARRTATTGTAAGETSIAQDLQDGPARDRWYLDLSGPQPMTMPILF